jgi:predicted amidophosphoribosyltransferase
LYEGVLRELILLFKYGEILLLKHQLTDWLVHIVPRKAKDSFDYILPVPMDPGRKRGINPTLELARGVAKKLKIPLARNWLIKGRSTEPQVGLSMKRRETNLKGAFQLNKIHRLKSARVLMVDDVFTTGTTVSECAKPLTEAGSEVVIVTLAKSRF